MTNHLWRPIETFLIVAQLALTALAVFNMFASRSRAAYFDEVSQLLVVSACNVAGVLGAVAVFAFRQSSWPGRWRSS